MIVEIVGPTGVGKTTFIRKLVYNLDNKGLSTGSIHSVELNKLKTIPKTFVELKDQNIKTDLRALIWTIKFYLTYPRFFIFFIHRIIQSDVSIKEKLSVFRSVNRKAGIFLFLSQKKFEHHIIVVDEGIFHSVHNLLVSAEGPASDQEIKKFLKLCPLADFIFVLNASTEILIENLQLRGNLSPRIKKPEQVTMFVKSAKFVFDLIGDYSIQNPLIISLELSRKNYEKTLKTVTKIVCKRVSFSKDIKHKKPYKEYILE
jgi:broad-specificity NMP kinase